LPNVGESRVTCPQAELELDVVLTVQTTPNPSFRRVDAQVFLKTSPLLRVSTVLGR
jgi:general secretion pathway protein I